MRTKARDDDTIAFYAREAEAYTTRGTGAEHRHLQRFMATLPARGSVLELGCGAGQDSEAMLAAGFDVTPTDGTPEIAQAAERRLGRPVKVLLFDETVEVEAFDGIWANACLLHVPRAELAAIIGRIHAALKPGGTFYASFKTGAAEGRDRFGRYYNYPDADFLRAALRPEGWASIDMAVEAGSGYYNLPADWLHLLAIKRA
ncbi:class I SAM-dependent methyltransferase [Mesorhizobium sp. IMUNJ 23232]|uniref:class I SAM-dependent methyltransferase n=1 Tax=Mesorhizobium sp. IMUNJ 23232 TaxID=3376064 RepID=UPI00378840BB